MLINILTPNFETNLNLCLAAATQNLKCLKLETYYIYYTSHHQ